MTGKFTFARAASARSRCCALAITMSMAVIALSLAAIPAAGVPLPVISHNYELRMGDGAAGRLNISTRPFNISYGTFVLTSRTKFSCTTTGSRNSASDPNGTQDEVKTLDISGTVAGKARRPILAALSKKTDIDIHGYRYRGFYRLGLLRISPDGGKIRGNYFFWTAVSSLASPALGFGAYYEKICSTAPRASFTGTRSDYQPVQKPRPSPITRVP